MTNEWRPIEEAPRDGTPILVWWTRGQRASIVRWNTKFGYNSFTTGSFDRFGVPDQYAPDWFTAWHPLPDPPPPPKHSIKSDKWMKESNLRY